MGYDMSYHPISEEQIDQWYFNVLENHDLIIIGPNSPRLASIFGGKFENGWFSSNKKILFL